MLPSSLSTRSLSCSLFWQLRISLMNTESPRIPDIAIAYGARRSLSSLSLQIPKLDWIADSIGSKREFERWLIFSSELRKRERKRKRRRGRRRIQLWYDWSRERNSSRGERERERGWTDRNWKKPSLTSGTAFYFPFSCHFTNSVIPSFSVFFSSFAPT